ncbi:unnamed protein product [Urochloa decumbens]|uniref:Transmembrane protein n=1 Tax=Urochloa decumbens TaxID=240449 RepID=A0ABC9AWY7_9POAL
MSRGPTRQSAADQVDPQQDQNRDIEAGRANPNFMLSETLSEFFKFPVLTMTLFYVQFKYTSMSSWWSIVSLVSLGLAFILQFVEWITREHICNQNKLACCTIDYFPCKIAYCMTVLRMAAAASLLLLLGTRVHLLVVLPLLLLVLALVVFFFWNTFYCSDPPGFGWMEHKEELRLRFDISSKVVSMAFAGLIGVAKGYVESPSNMTRGYMVSECFMFYSAVLGLLVMLLCTVPIALFPRHSTRARMAKVYIPILSYVALLFLVLAGILAAEGILQEYVFFVCFATVATAVLCFMNDYCKGTTRVNTEQDTKISQQIHVAFSAPLFGLLMSVHLKYGNGNSSIVSSSWWFKGFVLLTVCGILNYAACMVVIAEVQVAYPRWAWKWATYLTMASTLICGIGTAVLYPEVKTF